MTAPALISVLHPGPEVPPAASGHGWELAWVRVRPGGLRDAVRAAQGDYLLLAAEPPPEPVLAAALAALAADPWAALCTFGGDAPAAPGGLSERLQAWLRAPAPLGGLVRMRCLAATRGWQAGFAGPEAMTLELLAAGNWLAVPGPSPGPLPAWIQEAFAPVLPEGAGAPPPLGPAARVRDAWLGTLLHAPLPLPGRREAYGAFFRHLLDQQPDLVLAALADARVPVSAGADPVQVHRALARLLSQAWPGPGAAPEPRAAAPAEPWDPPIHFFTIVLNGEPFIRHHLEVFRQLDCRWHWHIVEGVALQHHDSAWMLHYGGRVEDGLHHGGLSKDGTREYLDRIAAEHPGQVTVHRKPQGEFWDGKLEMVNAPLAGIREACLLWQVDVDELWTVEQVQRCRALFAADRGRRTALFRCEFFVGPDLLVTTRDTYGNPTARTAWNRVWHHTPGCRWSSHSPPILVERREGGDVDLFECDPFMHDETEALGLVFQHMAYATEATLAFKEVYYGYRGAVAGWRRLQAARPFPVLLRDFFPWVQDLAVVDTAGSRKVRPLATRALDGTWSFRAREAEPGRAWEILVVLDGGLEAVVQGTALIRPLAAAHPGARITLVCPEACAALVQASPVLHAVIAVDPERFAEDSAYRTARLRDVIGVGADLCLCPAPEASPRTVALALASKAGRRLGFFQEGAAFTQVLALPDPCLSHLDLAAALLAGLGLDGGDPRPELWPGDEDGAWARTLLQERDWAPGRVLAAAAGAAGDPAHWPPLLEVAAAVAAQAGLGLVLLGPDGPGAPPGALDLRGRLTPGQCAAVLRACRALAAVESPLVHLACGLGVPQAVALGGGCFGAPLPYSPLTTCAALPLDCFGCGWQCPWEVPHCTRDLAPEVFRAALAASLAGESPVPRLYAQRDWRGPGGGPGALDLGPLLDPDKVALVQV